MNKNKKVLTLASVAALAATGAHTLSAAEVAQPVKGDTQVNTQTNGQSSVKDIEVVNKNSKENYNKAVEAQKQVPNLQPIVEGQKAKVEPVVQQNQKAVDAFNEKAKQEVQDFNQKQEQVKVQNAQAVQTYQTAQTQDVQKSNAGLTQGEKDKLSTQIKSVDSVAKADAVKTQIDEINKKVEAQNEAAKVKEAKDAQAAKQAQDAVDQKNKDALAKYKTDMNAKVDASDLTKEEKAELKTLIASTSVDSKAVDAKIDALNNAHQAAVDKQNKDEQAKIKAENDAATAKYEADKAAAAKLDAAQTQQEATAQAKVDAQNAKIEVSNAKTNLLDTLQKAAHSSRSSMDSKEYNALVKEIAQVSDKASADALKTKIDAFVKKQTGNGDMSIQTVSKLVLGGNTDIIAENPGLEITFDQNTGLYHFNKDISVFGSKMTEQEFNAKKDQLGFIDSKNEEVKTTAAQLAEDVKNGSDLPVSSITIASNGKGIEVKSTLDQKTGLVKFEIVSRDLVDKTKTQNVYSGSSISAAETALNGLIGSDKASTFYEELGGKLFQHQKDGKTFGWNQINSDFINDLVARITTSDRYAKDGDSVKWNSWYTSVDINTGQQTKVVAQTPAKMIQDILEKGSSTSANDLGSCFSDSVLNIGNVYGFGGGGFTINTKTDASSGIVDHCTIYTGQTEKLVEDVKHSASHTVQPPVLKTYTDVVYNKLDKDTLVIDTSKLSEVEKAKLLDTIKTETLDLKDVENEKVFKAVELPKVDFDKLSLPGKIEEVKHTIEKKIETPKTEEVKRTFEEKAETPKTEEKVEAIKEVAQKVEAPKEAIKEVAQEVKETKKAQPEAKVVSNSATKRVRGAAKDESKNVLMPLVLSVLALFGLTIKRKRK